MVGRLVSPLGRRALFAAVLLELDCFPQQLICLLFFCLCLLYLRSVLHSNLGLLLLRLGLRLLLHTSFLLLWFLGLRALLSRLNGSASKLFRTLKLSSILLSFFPRHLLSRLLRFDTLRALLRLLALAPHLSRRVSRLLLHFLSISKFLSLTGFLARLFALLFPLFSNAPKPLYRKAFTLGL